MKQIMAIHLKDRTYVDQDVLQRHCEHEHTATHYIRDNYTGDTDYEVVCLDCGMRIDEPYEYTSRIDQQK